MKASSAALTIAGMAVFYELAMPLFSGKPENLFVAPLFIGIHLVCRAIEDQKK